MCDTEIVTEENIKAIFKQVIQGVSYMHGKNYYHGDLKLENILINENNQVVIIDFGLAGDSE